MKLNGTWKLYFAPEGEHPIPHPDQLSASGIPSIPCTVPGNVELDLSAAGFLPQDLFKGENILQAEKYEHYAWWYETTFPSPSAPALDEETILRFRGADCFATYWLNGEYLGESDNMFIAHEFDVTDRLRQAGENTLHVHITSAAIRGAAYPSEPLCDMSWHQDSVQLQVRKAAHNYGWDIMPRAVSAGLWRDVELEKRSKYRFRYLLLQTDRLVGTTAKASLC